MFYVIETTVNQLQLNTASFGTYITPKHEYIKNLTLRKLYCIIYGLIVVDNYFSLGICINEFTVTHSSENVLLFYL